MKNQLTQAVKHWSYVAPIVKYPNSKKEYHQLLHQLEELLDIVGENENHKLISLIDVIGHLISAYEENHLAEIKHKGLNALRYLMTIHHLNQSDLTEIGSQGVVSEILCGKRQLNVRQIKLLAKRFHVDPATFIDD